MAHASTARVHADSAAPVATGAGAAAVWLDAHLQGRPVPPVLLAIGLGDGALLDVLDRRENPTRLVAIEPDPTVAASVMRQPAFARWLEAGRLTYLVGPAYAGADQAWRALRGLPERADVIVHPSVRERGGPAAMRAAEVLRGIVFGAQANEEARRRFAPRYLANTIRNIPALARGLDVNVLRGRYAGIPAILTAAGPSLDDSLDELAAVSDRAILIAADTTLRTLLAAGIAPRFVVAADPGAANARHFASLPDCAQTWLIAESAIDPSALAPFEGHTLWFRVANHHPWPWLRSLGLDAGTLEMWGSVLTAAFQTAMLAGCDPIVFAGADLAYTGGRPYCRGTAYEFDWAAAVASGVPLEAAWRAQAARHDLGATVDIHGRETMTSGALQSFRDWLVARADRCGRTIVNATGGGILTGSRITQLRLADAMGGCSPLRLEPVGGPALAGDRASLAAGVRAVERALSSGSDGRSTTLTSPLEDWAAFLADAYDPGPIAAALEETARTLESDARGSAGHRPAAWSAFSGGRLLTSSVPEWTSRLRQALTGEADADTCDRATAAVRLRQAFELLVHVTENARRHDDLPPSWNGFALGHVPIGSAIAWPESLSWPVRLIEALIGSTLNTRFPVTGDVFETRPVALREPESGVVGEDAAVETAADGVCRMLALEWLLAVNAHEAPHWMRDRAIHWIRAIQPALIAGQGDIRRTATLAVSLTDPGWSGGVSFPLAVDERRLARLLTGTLALSSDRPRQIDLWRSEPGAWSCRVSLSLTSVPTPLDDAPAGVLVRPRVLSDEGQPTSWLAYSAPDGAICARTDGTGSMLIRQDGSVEPARDWPRPVTGAAVLGPDLEIAWSVGTARWPEGGNGYVMWRRAGQAQVTIEELPYGPGVATIANGRVYWACFPFGWASWAPGDPTPLLNGNLSLYGVRPDADGVVLHPRLRNDYGGTERRLSRQGLRLAADGTVAPLDLGPYGSITMRAQAHGWSAAAHPEADLVALTSVAGTSATLTVYRPYAVAWADRSLVVTTVSGEVLFFEALADRLPAGREVPSA